jgi:hypothetical protein
MDNTFDFDFDFDLDVATILFNPIVVVLGLVFFEFEFEAVFTFFIVLLVEGVTPVFLGTDFDSGLVLTVLLDDDDDDDEDNLLLAPAIFIYLHIFVFSIVLCDWEDIIKHLFVKNDDMRILILHSLYVYIVPDHQRLFCKQQLHC